MEREIQELRRQIINGMRQTDAFLRILEITDSCCKNQATRSIMDKYDELENRIVALEQLMESQHEKISDIRSYNYKMGRMVEMLRNQPEEEEQKIEEGYDSDISDASTIVPIFKYP